MNARAFSHRLREESADWVTTGVITSAQREALLARYPELPDTLDTTQTPPLPQTSPLPQVTEAHRSNNRFVAILGMIGGALLLTGVCLVISSNWEAISDWTKIIGLVALLIGSYAAGWRLGVSPGNFPRTGDACFMVGAGLLLAGIALVSQIFHLDSRPSNGVLAWWIGIAAAPWLVRSVGAQFLSLVAGLVWVGMEMATRDSWLSITTEHARYYDSWVFFIYVAVYLIFGAAVWLAGLALRDTRRCEFAGMHEKWGALLVCSGLYAFGFAHHARGGYRHYESELLFSAPVPMIAASIVLLLAIWGAWRAVNERRTLLALAPGLLAAVLVSGFVGMVFQYNTSWLWWISVIASIVLFVLNLLMIRAGLVGGRASWVNLGIAFIALNIITRYIDLVGSMLHGGLFFISLGIVVIGLGIFLERKRRAWVSTVRARQQSQSNSNQEATR